MPFDSSTVARLLLKGSVLGTNGDWNEHRNRIVFSYPYFEDGLRSLPEDDAHLIDRRWRCVHDILDPDC
jgi:hypothetical protein